jgi:hypothetical protein
VVPLLVLYSPATLTMITPDTVPLSRGDFCSTSLTRTRQPSPLFNLPPESLYRLLRLAETVQFPSRLSIEENKEFIIPHFTIFLAFLGQHVSDLRHLPLCDEFGRADDSEIVLACPSQETGPDWNIAGRESENRRRIGMPEG